MLTNYDAKAVADVMGIAFVRGSPDAEAAKASSRRFVISVGDSSVEIVDAVANRTAPAPDGAKGGSDHASRSKRGLVWPSSPMLIEKAVENGLPRRALRHLAEQLAGGDPAKVSRLEWILVPKTTLERRAHQLSPQESERTERVARLYVHARRALGTAEEAREFMTAPHPQLEHRSPIDAARTDLGTRRTEQILNALEYGLAL